MLPDVRIVGERDGVRLPIKARQCGEPPVDPAREQGEALVGRDATGEGGDVEGHEVLGRRELLADGVAVIGGVRRVVGDVAVGVDESHEARVFHAVRLRCDGGPQDTAGQFDVLCEVDPVAAFCDGAQPVDRGGDVAARVALGPERGEPILEALAR